MTHGFLGQVRFHELCLRFTHDTEKRNMMFGTHDKGLSNAKGAKMSFVYSTFQPCPSAPGVLPRRGLTAFQDPG